MIPDPIREQWLAGEDVAVVAPTLNPAALAVPERRVLLIAVDATSALLLAAATGAPLLLRTTGSKHRERTVSGADPLVVVALDDLHVPSYRALLAGPWSDWPRVIWGADAVHRLGRQAFVGELVGSALSVHPSVAAAPDGAVVLDLPSGVVRSAETLAQGLVPLGGGILHGRKPAAAALGGLKARRHRLDRPFGRAWVGADRALRSSSPGFEVVDWPAGTLTAGSRAVGTQAVDSLFVPEGSVAIVAVAEARAATWHERAATLRDGARVGGERSWVLGAASDGELLGDLVELGVLSAVRPVWTRAKVANAESLFSPPEDAPPAGHDFAQRYRDALAAWSDEDRARLALTDHEPRSLADLAEALGVAPSVVCDVIMDWAAVNPASVRMDGLAFEGRPGPSFDGDFASLTPPDRAPPAWLTQAGCRTAAYREAMGLSRGDDCGACEHCDPAGDVLRSRNPSPAPAADPGAESPESPKAESAPPAEPAGPSRPTAEALSAIVERGDDEAIRSLAAEAGGATALLASCILRFQGPVRDGAIPAGIAARALELLVALSAPWGAAPDGVTEARPGTWTAAVDGTEETWSFVRRRGGAKALPSLLARLAKVYPADEGLSRLTAARAARAQWETVVAALEPAVRLVLERPPGALDRAALLAPVLVATATLEAAVGQPATFSNDLVHVLAADPAALEPHVRGFVGKAEPKLHHRVAARAAALSENVPTLSAGELARWWSRDGESLGERTLRENIGRLTKARRAEIAALLQALPASWRPEIIEAGLRLGSLPRELLTDVLADADVERAAGALVASTPNAGRARRLWREQRAALGSLDFGALRAALTGLDGPVAAAFVQLIDADLADRATRAAERAAIVALADGGGLAEAAERLAALPAEPIEAPLQAALDSVKARAVARQTELVAPVAAVLAGATGDEAEDAAFAAIEDSIQEGFGRALVALLSKQHRRTPDDPARALWLARALCLSGDWAEGQRVYGVAACLRKDINARIATEFEGIFLAFEEGEAARGVRWIQSAVAMPWHQVVLPQVTSLVDDGLVPGEVRGALADVLEGTGSPFYGDLIAALRG